MKFHANTLDKVKPPSDEQMVQAFRLFFKTKLSSQKAVNPTQALLIRQAVEHLQSDKTDAQDAPNVNAKKKNSADDKLSTDDLLQALRALAIQHRQGPSEDVAELATVIYNELEPNKTTADDKDAKFNSVLQRYMLEPIQTTADNQNVEDKLAKLNPVLQRYISILTHHKQTLKAAGIVSEFQNLVTDDKAKSEETGKACQQRLFDIHLLVLRGYAREADHDRLRSYAQMMCDAGFPYTPLFQLNLTGAFASMGEAGEKELQEWFEKPLADGKWSKILASEHLPHPKTYLHLIKFASQIGRQPEWINTALQQLCDSNPQKRWWDVIFQWAVYQGKDISHLRKMVDVVVQVNPEVNPDDESVRVDILTINGMLEAAIAKKEHFLAERINSMASELGLRPDERTHMALLRARIEGQDKIGAASTFDEIVHSGQFLPDSRLSKAANLYIRSACVGSTSAEIIQAVSRFEARHGELEPVTVADVCMRFLRDDQKMEVVDTLGLHLNQFSMDERRLIRTEFLQYCLDMSISTARAWDTYSLLRQFWPETPKEERTKIMQAFFSRKRPDMACHVFGHMRAHPDNAYRPDLDHYVLCLENLGAYPDRNSVAMIHNMLKMDARIQPSTKLYNAFIIAFTGSNETRKAFEFWRQVANSKDGPTYKSLELVFRACQRMPYGHDRAKVIWDKMATLEVDVPVNVYDAFILMLAGQGRLGDAGRMLLQRFAEYDEEPSQIL